MNAQTDEYAYALCKKCIFYIYMSRACQSQEIVLDLVVRKSTPYTGDPGRPAKMVSHKQ